MPIIIFCSLATVHAQECAPKGISTNPASATNPIPYKKNTFDWTATNFALNQPAYPSILSPFYQSVGNVIQFYYNKDNKPKDGWEIVAYRTGYYPAPLSINNEQIEFPILMLYNRRTAILRTFVAKVTGNFPFNAAQIDLSLQAPTSNTIKTDMFNLERPLLPFNTPFGDSTRIPGLTGVAKYTDENARWFYVDFPIIYDACTCYHKSNISIKVQLIQNANLTLTGSINGSLTPTDPISGKPTVADGPSRGFSKVLGTIFGTMKKVTEAHKTTSDFVSLFSGKSNVSETKSGITNLGTEMKKGSFLKTGLKALPWLGAALAGIDFLTTGVKQKAVLLLL